MVARILEGAEEGEEQNKGFCFQISPKRPPPPFNSITCIHLSCLFPFTLVYPCPDRKKEMARSVAGRSEDRTSDDDESKKVGKVGEPLSATPQSLSSPKDSIHSSSSPTPDPNRQNGSKKLPTCPMTPSDNMSVHADDDVTVEEASQQKKAVSSQNKNEPKLIVPEGEDNTEIFKEEFSEKEGDEKSDDGMKRDDEPFHESSKEEESHIEEEQEVDYEEDESQHEDVQPKKVKKGRNISKGRVSAQLNGEIIDEKAQKTPSKNGPTKKRSREDQQGDLMETEISPEVWVEIESPNKQSTSDTNEEGGENEEKKKPAKKARRTHLAEKSTNVKREAIRGKAEQKEQVKATRAKSNGVIPRRSEEREPKRRLTPRQKDLHETSKTKTVSPLMLNLPSGFEKAAKKALQACFNDKMKAVEGDSILILLDLFQQ